MAKDLRVGAAGFFQCIRQDGQTSRIELTAWVGTVLVGGLSQRHDGGCPPGRGEDYGVEGVAE
jgi:hypothetical protein